MEEWYLVDDRDLQGWKRRRGLRDLPALHLWRRSALPRGPRGGGVQPQATPAQVAEQLIRSRQESIKSKQGRAPTSADQ